MNKEVRSWVLYDFANSLVSIIVGFYFALYFVDTLGLSDIWISIVSVVSTLVLLFTLPLLGLRADKVGLHKKYLTIASICAALCVICLGVFMNDSLKDGFLVIPIVIILYFLFQVFFQAALAFYNSFLKGISVGKEDKVAGIGNGFGQLGNVAGLAIGFFIVSKQLNIFYLDPISFLFVLNAIIFLIIFYFIRKGFIQKPVDLSNSYFKISYTESLKKVWANKNVFYYLIAFLLYSDSILTLNIFVSLYMRKAGGLTDSNITILGIISLMFGVTGALLTPWFNKKIGSQKRAITIYIIAFGILLFLFAFCKTYVQFLTCMIFAGLLFGVLFSASISMYTNLVPKKEEAEYFSFYVLFSRFASIIGPPLWSLTAYLFASKGDDKYRFSIIMLSILVFASLFFMRKVKEEPILGPETNIS